MTVWPDADLDAIAIAERRASLVAKSTITLTRCSSTPSADTFMKPEGSTRRTRALERLRAAPLLDDHRRAGGTRTASVDSRSETISSSRVADLEQRLTDRDHRRALAQPLQHDAVDRRDDVDGPPPPLDGVSRAPRELQLVLRRATANSAARTPPRRSSTPSARASSSSPEIAPFTSALQAGAAVDCARVQRRLAARARARPGPGRRRHGRLDAPQLRLRARIDQRRSGRRQPRDDGLAATTRSPGSSSIRSTRPITGRRDDEPLADARLAFLVDRHLHRPRASTRRRRPRSPSATARPPGSRRDDPTTPGSRRCFSSRIRIGVTPGPSAPRRDRAVQRAAPAAPKSPPRR